ncbi:MAG: hypothetical protein O2900_04770 [Proteobacteria bacterium]|nr:hypothetical protein [Pseudomonadota bacterium]
MQKKIISFSLLLIFLSGLAEAIERRRSQFPRDFGYLIAPIPYILPGVGTGLGVIGAFNNTFDSTTDFFLVGVGGDVEGTITGVTDIELLPENVLLDVTYVGFNKGSQKQYGERGIDSDPKDFNIVELKNTSLYGGRLTFTFLERRLEFFTLQYNIRSEPSAVIYQGKEDNRQEYADPEPFTFKRLTYGTQIDVTDDRLDPRMGVRFVATRSESPSIDADSSESYTVDTNLTGYIPLLESSTFAINYFRSDATVTKEGVTDYQSILDKLRDEYGCTAGGPCDESLKKLATDTQVSRKYGTASSLGGSSRLRSYAGGRFSGAHTEFYGYEFRWNLTDENTPFDLYFIRDFRTGFQLAFFYETGTVAEQREDLWAKSRNSTGLGARLVTGSGFIYRFDVATGSEGQETTLFVDYPWGTIAQ